MTHPDRRVREIRRRNDAELRAAAACPPAHLTDDPAAYIAWLRAPAPKIGQTPHRPRTYRGPAPNPEAAPKPRQRPQQRHPEYRQAQARLAALPDLGAAAIEAARTALGPDAGWEEVVIHAADHPVNTAPAASPAAAARTADDAAACGACGTVLDPDGTCFACTQKGAPE